MVMIRGKIIRFSISEYFKVFYGENGHQLLEGSRTSLSDIDKPGAEFRQSNGHFSEQCCALCGKGNLSETFLFGNYVLCQLCVCGIFKKVFKI